MKEATGELNMTVVTVVAIAAVGAFFYAFVWPAIQTSIQTNTACAAATNCQAATPNAETVTCNGDGDLNGTIDVNETITCPNNNTTDTPANSDTVVPPAP